MEESLNSVFSSIHTRYTPVIRNAFCRIQRKCAQCRLNNGIIIVGGQVRSENRKTVNLTADPSLFYIGTPIFTIQQITI